MNTKQNNGKGFNTTLDYWEFQCKQLKENFLSPADKDFKFKISKKQTPSSDKPGAR